MKNIRVFCYLNKFSILKTKFSIYLNKRVFVMKQCMPTSESIAEDIWYMCICKMLQSVHVNI